MYYMGIIILSISINYIEKGMSHVMTSCDVLLGLVWKTGPKMKILKLNFWTALDCLEATAN